MQICTGEKSLKEEGNWTSIEATCNLRYIFKTEPVSDNPRLVREIHYLQQMIRVHTFEKDILVNTTEVWQEIPCVNEKGEKL